MSYGQKDGPGTLITVTAYSNVLFRIRWIYKNLINFKSPQQKQKQQSAQQIYGFVPFKNAAGIATANHNQKGGSMYGTANIRPSNPPPQIHPVATDYLHSS
jgi:hypothetical protein